MEPQHEKEVQHRIQPGGYDEEVEGTAAVAHGPENSGTHVVDQQAHDAGEIDGEIGGGLRHDLRRRVHKTQQEGCQSQAQPGKGDAHKKGDHHGGVDGLGDLAVALGTVVLADDHTGAAAQAHEKADQHVDDGPHTAHGGEGLVGHVVAHHPGVHHIIELLEHVARQQGQGKEDQMPGDAAAGHIHVVAGAAGGRLAQGFIANFLESPNFYTIIYSTAREKLQPSRHKWQILRGKSEKKQKNRAIFLLTNLTDADKLF